VCPEEIRKSLVSYRKRFVRLAFEVYRLSVNARLFAKLRFDNNTKEILCVAFKPLGIANFQV
jgi:hypothetical protein